MNNTFTHDEVKYLVDFHEKYDPKPKEQMDPYQELKQLQDDYEQKLRRSASFDECRVLLARITALTIKTENMKQINKLVQQEG